MGFLEIESLCLSTGQVKCKQKGSSLLAAVFWPTHCSVASLWFCREVSHIPCAEALAQLSADAVTFVCSLRKMQRNLPGCWGKKVRWSVDQARMESIWCPSTLPWSNRKVEQLRRVQTWTVSSTQPQPETGESRPSLWFYKGLTDTWQVIRQPANSLLHCTNVFGCLLVPGSMLGTRDSVRNKTKQQP